jgi:hypothetical protein
MDKPQPAETAQPPSARHCPTCLGPPPTANPRRIYCSPVCKSQAWKREHAHGTNQPPAPPRTTTPAPAANIRDCPNCGHPVAVVVLLTTPHVARPDTPRDIR